MMQSGILSDKRKIQLNFSMFQILIFIRFYLRGTAGIGVLFYEAYL